MGLTLSRYIIHSAVFEPPQIQLRPGLVAQQQATHETDPDTGPRSHGPRQGQGSAQQRLGTAQLVLPSTQRQLETLERQGSQRFLDSLETNRTLPDPLNPSARPDYEVSTVRPFRTREKINNLSQYLQWRREGGRSVSPQTQRLLQRATNAVETVREQIPMRGNVRTDIEQTDGEATRRQVAARYVVPPALERLMVKDSRFSQTRPELQEVAVRAAAAKITGSGNCHEFLTATLLEAGPQLEKNETLFGVLDEPADHCFAVLKSDRDDGTDRVVVLDAWANGPAVLLEDQVYEHQPTQYGPEISVTEFKEIKRLADTSVEAYNQDAASLDETKNTLQYLKDESYSLHEEDLYDEKNIIG